MRVLIKSLEVGQEVMLANCREPSVVLERVGKNLYRVSHKGGVVEVSRNQVSVKVNGRWVRYEPVKE